MKNIVKNIVKDIKVDLSQAFDNNFDKKAFFTENWDKTQGHNHIGSLMQRSGKLRRSINSQIRGDKVLFTSNMPYAQIHNEGGTITVTAKMKRFFWAMYMRNCKSKKPTPEAMKWKALALKKVGSKITMPKRQFIGFDHPEVGRLIKENIDWNMKDLDQQIKQQFKTKHA